jgi:hypothetical protein
MTFLIIYNADTWLMIFSRPGIHYKAAMPGVQEAPIYFVKNQNIRFNNIYSNRDLPNLHPCEPLIP